MKNHLKITFLSLVCLSIITQVSSQSIGIKAGLNLADMIIKDDHDTYSENTKMNPGFHAGVVVEIPISGLLSVEPGLLISKKGLKMVEEESFGGQTYKYTAVANLYYLDIPINLRLGFDVGPAKIFGLAGPYIGIGLSGKSKYTEEDGSETNTETEDLEWGNDPETHDLKRPDYGVTFGAGVQFTAIELSVTYGLGLANISTDTEDGMLTKNRVLGISLAYKFGR